MFHTLIGAAVLVFVFLIVLSFVYVLYRRAWKIPAPNEALIIVGKQRGKQGGPVDAASIDKDPLEAINEGKTEGMDFRISTGATWVNPVTSRVFPLPLDSRSTNFVVDCHDKDKIALRVEGVILYKVGDNYAAMSAAARRFLNMDPDHLNKSIENLVTGQVRALVGSMTIPQLITDRQVLMDNVRDATHEDMAKLGLQIDSLTVQGLSDDKNYIDNLGRPQAELVAREAAIAVNQARQQTEASKFEADLKIAEAQRDTQVTAASYQAEQDTAREQAAQAGPLAKAEAQRGVVSKETEVAELRVAMTEKQLDAGVKKRADAELYAAQRAADADLARITAAAEGDAVRHKKVGEAEAAAIEAKGAAEVEVVKNRGLAEAMGIEKKAEALATHGDLVIREVIAQNLPEMAESFAKPFGSIDNMVVLDGPEGLTKGIVGAITAAGEAVRELKGLGHVDRPEPASENGPNGAGPRREAPQGPQEPFQASTPVAVPTVAELSASEERAAAPAATQDYTSLSGLPPVTVGEQSIHTVREQLSRLDVRNPEAALEQIQADDAARDAAIEVARDPNLVGTLLDESGLTGKRREIAERFLTKFGDHYTESE